LQLVAEREDLVGVAQRHAAVVGELQLAPALAEQVPPRRSSSSLIWLDRVCGVVCSCSPARTTPPAFAATQK
jgi:hypothetical protein